MSAHETDDMDVQEVLEYCANKRRKMVLNAQLVSALYMACPTQRLTGPNRVHERPFSWRDHCSQMNAEEFKKRYRLTPHLFDVLLEKVRPALSATDLKQAVCSKGIVAFIPFFLFIFALNYNAYHWC